MPGEESAQPGRLQAKTSPPPTLNKRIRAPMLIASVQQCCSSLLSPRRAAQVRHSNRAAAVRLHICGGCRGTGLLGYEIR